MFDTSTELYKYVMKKGGVIKFASSLCIDPARVRHWLKHNATPSAPMIDRIIKQSCGELTFSKIWESTRPKTIRKK